MVQELILKKHPKSSPAAPGSILEGPELNVERSVIFESIDGTLIHACAKQTATGGSAGPSGLDSD